MEPLRRARAYPQPLKPRKTFGDWLLFLLGWILVFGGVGLVVYWLRSAPPQGELVCTQPAGAVSLTRWGTCRRE